MARPDEVALPWLLRPRDSVAAVFAEDATDGLATVHEMLRRATDPPTVLTCVWSPALGLVQGVKDLARVFADAATGLYPNWYGSAPHRLRTESGLLGLHRVEVELKARSTPGALVGWAEQAASRVESHRPPLVPDMGHGAQIQQLALAIDTRMLVALVALDQQCGPSELAPYCAAVEWLKGQGLAQVIAVVPRQLGAAPEVQRIAYEARALEAVATGDRSEPVHVLSLWPADRRLEGARSLGELMLRRWLRSDPELGSLFVFGQRVETALGSRFECDAYWPEGGLCVEIDGFYWHTKRAQFRKDRLRVMSDN